MRGILSLFLLSEKISLSQKVCGDNEGSGEAGGLLNVARGTESETRNEEIEIFGELEEDCVIIKNSECINVAYRFKKLSISGSLEDCSRIGYIL